jgi:hypothetical protein
MKIFGTFAIGVVFAVGLVTLDAAAAAPNSATLRGVQSFAGSGVTPAHCRIKRHCHSRHCKGRGKNKRCYPNYCHRCG